jgi:hypothetical protein
MKMMHAALDLLIESNVLSLPCQSFVTKSKRQAECFDDVIYGEILSFTVFTSHMNMPSSRWAPPPKPTVTKLQENTPNGYAICNNVPFNIELVLNPCVNTVAFTMINHNGTFPPMTRTDAQHPMVLFESMSRMRSPMSSSSSSPYATTRFLPPGSYTLSAIPDNFPNKEKRLEFHVIVC